MVDFEILLKRTCVLSTLKKKILNFSWCPAGFEPTQVISSRSVDQRLTHYASKLDLAADPEYYGFQSGHHACRGKKWRPRARAGPKIVPCVDLDYKNKQRTRIQKHHGKGSMV